jgi:hypothetical protein
MNRMNQVEGFAPLTALTASGGATPSVTGQAVDIGKSDGNISLFLINAGDSTSLTVTYQFGYITRANEKTRTITWITPEGGGGIVNLTTVDIHGSSKHEAISVDPTMYIRFICTNNDAVNAATMSLYVVFQES